MAEISDILTTLLERTRQDKISWQSTADDSAFLAVVGKGSVMIIEDQLYENIFVLRILNSEGREIESMAGGSRSAQTNLEEGVQLRELYSMARRIALGVDSQLDDLLKELQAGD